MSNFFPQKQMHANMMIGYTISSIFLSSNPLYPSLDYKRYFPFKAVAYLISRYFQSFEDQTIVCHIQLSYTKRTVIIIPGAYGLRTRS